MNWLITGGCGFIGTSLVRSLTEEGGHNVRVIDNLMVGDRGDLAVASPFAEADAADPGPISGDNPVELVVGDILDAELALRVAEGADVIVHLAANTGVAPSVEDPRADCTTNVLGTLNYLEAARHNDVSRFVFASSGAVVGEVEPPLHEEMPSHPVSPYGASKMANEGQCSAYFRTFGIETVALRFGNVYGPLSGHKNSAVAKFIRRAKDGETIEVYGDGTQTRDFIFVEDLIGAVRSAATVEGVGGEVFQIATNAETTVSEMLEKLIPALVEAGIPEPEIQKTAPRQGDVMRNFSDTSKAARLLGWQAETDLDAGLKRTVRWFMQTS